MKNQRKILPFQAIALLMQSRVKILAKSLHIRSIVYRMSLPVLVAVLLTASVTAPVFGAAKVGSVCKKVEQVRVVKGISFKCTKVGKKRIWRQVAATPVVIPVVEVTPSPSPSPSSIPTPIPTPSPTRPSDSLSYRNAMIYGVENSLLARRSDSGIFFDDDSREASSFSEIRQRAFQELNPISKEIEHPNVEFIFDVTESFPKKMEDLFRVEMRRAAALWNDYFEDKIKVYVSLVTEKDREYIKKDPYMRNNLPGIFDRFDSRNERPFVTGGGAFWHFEREWSGHIYLGTASWVDLNYINYEWPQVARHEFVHIVQDYAFAKNFKSLGLSQWSEARRVTSHRVQPLHFREGSANAISYLTAFRNLGWSSDALDWLFWIRSRDARPAFNISSVQDVIKALQEMECIQQCRPVSSSNPQKAFEYSYGLGAIFYEWVIGTYGFEGYKKMLDQLLTAQSFDEVIRRSFGVSKDELYERSAPYVFEVLTRLDPYRN